MTESTASVRVRAPRPHPFRSAARAGLALCAVLLAAPATSAHADEVAAAEAKYRTWLKRPSLYKRMQGRVALARTGTAKAIGVLADDYMRPEEPKDHVRYLIATLASETLGGLPEAPAAFAAWRARAKNPIDTWLWHRALLVDLQHAGRDAATTATSTSEPLLARIAAIRALATASDPEIPGVVTTVLAALPAGGPERAFLVEACAAAVRTLSGSLRDDAARDAIEQVARFLDDKGLGVDTHDVVARNLAALFGTDVLGPGSAPYLRELLSARERPEGSERPEPEYAGGPFFGLRAVGRRIVYVIDASDSMLQPLTPEERKVLRPVTPSDPGPPGKRKPLSAEEEDPLRWDRIKNRFDAAREVLKRSLRAMKPDQHYCVILFGDEARALPSTPGLRPVLPKSIETTVAELDRIKPDAAPGDASRPHGKLRGETNLHGGLRLAFRVTTEKPLGVAEYVDVSRTGCDAVFLLSDGNPTADDFKKTDKRDGEKAVKDRETLTPVEPPPELVFSGPYGHRPFEGYDYLTDDVVRLNLVRQAEIHCVAIGEVDDSLLRGIAEVGNGRFRRVGGD